MPGSRTSLVLPNPQPILWLRADRNVLLSNGTIGGWLDLSGSGNHVLQSVPANQPSLVTVNNHAAVQFTTAGSTQGLRTANSLSGTTFEYLVAGQSIGQVAGRNGFMVDLGSLTYTWYTPSTSNNTVAYDGTNGATVAITQAVDLIADVQFPAANVSNLSITQGGITTTATGNCGSANPLSQVTIGNDGAMTASANFLFYEVMIFAQALPAATSASLSRAMGARWGIQVP